MRGAPQAMAPQSAPRAWLLILVAVLLARSPGVWAQASAAADTTRSRVAVLHPYDGSAVFGQMWAAIHLAASHVNSRNSTLTDAAGQLPPWFQLELMRYDTEMDMAKTLAAMYSAITADGAAAIIGPAISQTAVPTSIVAGVLDTPLVSASASSNALSIEDQHSFFLRTVASDSVSATALVSVVRRYDWKAFVLLRVEDEYGSSMATQMSIDATSAGLTMLDVPYVSGDSKSMAHAIQTVSGSPHTVVVLVPLPTDVAGLVSSAAAEGLMGPGRLWVLHNSELLDSAVSLDLLQGILRVRSVLADASPVSGPGTGPEALRQALLHTPAVDFVPPDLMDTFEVVRGFLASSPILSYFACYAYDAVWTVALGLAAAKQQAGGSSSSPSGGQTLDSMLSVGFVGSSGTVSFTPDGERDRSTINHTLEFLNVKKSEDGEPLQTSWVASLNFADSARLLSEDSPGDAVVPVVWPDYTADVPVIAESCKQGTVYDAVTASCVYHVAVAVSYSWLPAARVVLGAYMAALHINNRNASVVPAAEGLPDGLRLKLTLWDSQYSAAGGVQAGLSAYGSKVIAAMGTSRSSSCIPFSHILLYSQTPVVSHACTSESLGSEDSFPYFARTIPTDTEAAAFMATTMIAGFGWQRIGVLYQDDSYGTSFYQQFSLSAWRAASLQGLGSTGLEVSGAAVSAGKFEVALTEMKQKGVRVFVLVILEGDEEFLRAASRLGMLGLGYTYITGDSDIMTYDWDVESSDGTLAKASSLVQGFLRMYFQPLQEPQYSVLDASAKEDGAVAIDDTFRRFLADQEVDPDEWLADGLAEDAYAVYAYDALWSIGLGLASAEQHVEGWMNTSCVEFVNCHGEQLAQHIRQLSFEGASGRVEFNLEEGDDGQSQHSGDRAGNLMNFPIHYWNSSTLSWVRAGQYQQSGPLGGRLELDEPIVWPGLSTSTPVDGSGCSASMFFDETTMQCETCGLGSYSVVPGSAACTPCPAGHFCASTQCTSCDSCDVYQYQNLAGQYACRSCPPNTVAKTRGATNITECLCKEGFYRRDGQPGMECYVCPSGGVCDGSVYAPYPAEGFWGDWGLVDMSVPDSEEARKAIHTIVFHKCNNFGWCSGSCSESAAALAQNLSGVELALIEDVSEGSLYQANLQRLCRSNTSELCSQAHDGRMCQSCADGFFALGDKCMRCVEPSGLFVTGAVISIIIVWYIINRVMASTYDAVDVMLIFFQNASTISAFSLNWDSVLIEYPFWLLAIVNFDVTFISPQCSWGSWSYGHGLVLQLVLPLIIITICLGMYFSNYWIVRLFSSMPHSPSSAFGAPPREPQVAGRLGMLCQLFRLATTRTELSMHGDAYICASASFINVVYHTMTLKCLEVLICADLPDGSQFLSAGPKTSCWEGVHIAYLVMSFLGLAIYTIGVPLTFYLILQYGRVHNLFRDDRFMRQWGWLYLRYEKEWFFWEIVIMIRRALLVLVLVSAKAVPSVQLVLGIVLVTTLITSHFYARPFISVGLDYLDTISLVSLMGLLCTGALFYDTYGRQVYDNWDLVVTCISLLLLLGCMFLVFIMVYHDIRYEEQLKAAGKKLRRSVCDIINPGISRMASAGWRLPGVGGPLRQLSLVNKASENPESRLIQMIKQEPLELTRTLELKVVETWLKDVHNVRSVKEPADDDGEASMARRSRESVLNFWLVNHWTTEVMSDQSPVSYYSQRPHSLFFGAMTEQNPFLIDYLLFAEPEALDRAKTVIREVRHAHVKYSQKGQVAQMVVPIDRGPFLAWLMAARTDKMSHVRELLVEMYQACHGGRHPSDSDDSHGEGNSFGRAIQAAIRSRLPDPNRFGMSDGAYFNREGNIVHTPRSRRGWRGGQSAPILSPGTALSAGGSTKQSFENIYGRISGQEGPDDDSGEEQTSESDGPDSMELPGQAIGATCPSDVGSPSTAAASAASSERAIPKEAEEVTQPGGGIEEFQTTPPRRRETTVHQDMMGLVQFDAEIQRLSQFDSELTTELLKLRRLPAPDQCQ